MKIPLCTIGCKVTGKHVNRGTGYGLEIPLQYRFIGAEKAVKWAEKNIKKVSENINKKVNKCVKQKTVKEKIFLQCPLYRERL